MNRLRWCVWSIHSVRCSDDLFGMNLTELMVVDEFEKRSMTNRLIMKTEIAK